MIKLYATLFNLESYKINENIKFGDMLNKAYT